jgi:hypothetical protein
VLFAGADSVFVTVEDVVGFWINFVYISVYVLLCTQTHKTQDPPVYNMVAASVQLVVSRLYLAVENPYVPIVCLVVTTRMIIKMRTVTNMQYIHRISVFMDSVYLSCLIMWGVSWSTPFMIAWATLEVFMSDISLMNLTLPGIAKKPA